MGTYGLILILVIPLIVLGVVAFAATIVFVNRMSRLSSKPLPKVCPSCGHKLVEVSKFCAECGAAIGEASPPDQPPESGPQG